MGLRKDAGGVKNGRSEAGVVGFSCAFRRYQNL